MSNVNHSRYSFYKDIINRKKHAVRFSDKYHYIEFLNYLRECGVISATKLDSHLTYANNNVVSNKEKKILVDCNGLCHDDNSGYCERNGYIIIDFIDTKDGDILVFNDGEECVIKDSSILYKGINISMSDYFIDEFNNCFHKNIRAFNATVIRGDVE